MEDRVCAGCVDAMAAFGRDRGFDRDELLESGLVKLRDEDRPTAIFTIGFAGG
jgi:hypothetical protein